MVFRKKKPVEEKEIEEDEVEEAPDIEPAKETQTTKERIEVVTQLPVREIREEVIDGVLVRYILATEALTEIMNQEE